MKNQMSAVVVIGLISVMAISVQAEDFVLDGTNQRTVDTDLGSLSVLRIFDQSQADVVSGGSVTLLEAWGNSTANVSGGSINTLSVDQSTTANVSGGGVDVLYARNLRSSGGIGVSISGGNVNVLRATIHLTDSESMTVEATPTAASLAPYGVAISGGTVANMQWDYIYAHNSSTMNMVGGIVYNLTALDSGIANVNGGYVSSLGASGSSTANVTGGYSSHLWAMGTSTTNISGGSVGYLDAGESCTLNVTGGSIDELRAFDSSTTILSAYDFVFGDGLTYDTSTKRITGIGTVSGKWLNGTPWSANIGINNPTAIILAVPEPASIAILGVGGLAILFWFSVKRKR